MLVENLVTTAEGLMEAILSLSEGKIDSYLTSGDKFTENAMISWGMAKDSLGEYIEHGNAVCKQSDDSYIVTIPIKFENADVSFVYLFNDSESPMTFGIVGDYEIDHEFLTSALKKLREETAKN